MKPQKIREIIVEFEQVRVVRRRARTQVLHCEQCGADSDFIDLARAAELFDAGLDALAGFVAANDCHTRETPDSSQLICIASLLVRMKDRDSERLELGS